MVQSCHILESQRGFGACRGRFHTCYRVETESGGSLRPARARATIDWSRRRGRSGFRQMPDAEQKPEAVSRYAHRRGETSSGPARLHSMTNREQRANQGVLKIEKLRYLR